MKHLKKRTYVKRCVLRQTRATYTMKMYPWKLFRILYLYSKRNDKSVHWWLSYGWAENVLFIKQRICLNGNKWFTLRWFFFLMKWHKDHFKRVSSSSSSIVLEFGIKIGLHRKCVANCKWFDCSVFCVYKIEYIFDRIDIWFHAIKQIVYRCLFAHFIIMYSS